jgi:hypothetical protein
MFKQTSLITFSPDTDTRAREAFRGQLEEIGSQQPFSYIGTGLPISFRGGDLVWHLHFPDETTWRHSGTFELLDKLDAESIVSEIDASVYEIERFGVTEPGIQNGVYRTLFMSVEPSASTETRLQIADELSLMPKYIPEIRNWGMNTTVTSRGERPWTHIWEQEFAEPGHLTGPYMMSAYHWAFIDRWFDGEMPEQAILYDGLRHSASEFAASIIGLY